MNVENIQKDFCIYEIEWQSYNAFIKKKIYRWTTNKTFSNLRDHLYKNILTVNYRYALDRQWDVARKNSISYDTIMSLINKLSYYKLLPLSLQPRMIEVEKCRVRKNQLHWGKFDTNASNRYYGTRLYRHVFRSQIISFLMQKSEDIRASNYFTMDEMINYNKMVQVFIDMDTTTKNCITFDQAVDNLYNKTMNDMGD